MQNLVQLNGDLTRLQAPREGGMATRGEREKKHVVESCSPGGNGHFFLFSSTDTFFY